MKWCKWDAANECWKPVPEGTQTPEDALKAESNQLNLLKNEALVAMRNLRDERDTLEAEVRALKEQIIDAQQACKELSNRLALDA